jgi:hypothetical protein
MNRELLANYAIRAREYSDAVARLGSQADVNTEFVLLFKEILRLQALCSHSSRELQSYIQMVTSTGERSGSPEQPPVRPAGIPPKAA